VVEKVDDCRKETTTQSDGEKGKKSDLIDLISLGRNPTNPQTLLSL
jgi:hypothetical protein